MTLTNAERVEIVSAGQPAEPAARLPKVRHAMILVIPLPLGERGPAYVTVTESKAGGTIKVEHKGIATSAPLTAAELSTLGVMCQRIARRVRQRPEGTP